ncbi:hypothetical protein B0H67DRAFT_646011 [Lasiosphaeris hirsuta]|uniref:Uncharacterized protein n=1 Tax=Lasiosphaeris hirsuta TaxID=260670 RepID=A0AA40AIB5_9PEZI|nr:hypothetical protein B0H67DRAFT_646011 [Lasiosphaeris hirsuta]
MTETEMVEDYHRYLRFYEEQDKFLTHRIDYEVLREVIAKLPNLQEVVIPRPKPHSAELRCDGPTLGSIECERQELGDVLAQHKASLESFALSDVRLASSTS